MKHSLAAVSLCICIVLAVCRSDALGQEAPTLNAEERSALLAERDTKAKQAIAAAKKGEFQQAQGLLDQVLKLEQSLFGDAHQKMLDTLDFKVLIAHAAQDWTGEIGFRVRAYEMGKTVHGEGTYQLRDLELKLQDARDNAGRSDVPRRQLQQAKAANNQAVSLHGQGKHAEAATLAEQAKSIIEQVLGKEHPDYATSLNNLALLYGSMGEYARVEPLYLEAKAILERALGKEHPDYASSLNNLAALYYSMGENSRAEPLFLEANAIYEKVLGKEHPSYASSLNNLASLYNSMGETARAEPLYLEAKAIYEKVLGKEHPHYATSLNNLADLYESMGEYARAEPLYLEATAIRERVLGKEHPSYASSLNNLAALYESMGEYARAELLYLEAKSIFEQVLGKEHPSYATSLSNLALLYVSMGETARAEPLFREALDGSSDFVRQTLRAQSEAAGLQFLASEFLGADTVLSVRRQLPGSDPAESYRLSWQSRGLLGNVLSERQQMRGESGKSRELYEQLGRVSGQLAQLTLASFSPKQLENRRRRLGELNEQKEEFERQLAATSEQFRRGLEIEQVLPADLMRLLSDDVAVVDLVETTVWNRPESGKGPLETTREYDAFVMRKQGDGHAVQWLHLGPAKAINRAVTDWLALIDQNRGGATSGAHPAAVLRQLLWDPIEAHLRGAKQVVVIPGSATSFVPWSALPGRQPGTFLLEDYTLSTALSGQQLYRQLTDPPSEKGELLLVGGVDYQSRDAAQPRIPTDVDAQPMLASRSAAVDAQNRIAWPYLPGTTSEADAIREIWPRDSGVQSLSGASANEEALRSAMPSVRYLHLATHGFFADAKFRSMLQYDPNSERLFGMKGTELLTAGRSTITGRNPLILSGVVLAGANLPPVKDELGLPSGADGIMTAQEVLHTDLRGTELVTLSACDTGRGTDVAGGEGIYGLQRAFHLAGARHVVASLWKVDDQATAALMKLFYRNLWEENQHPAEALRNAQLTLLNNPDRIEELASSRGAVRDTKPTTNDESTPRAPIRLWAAFTHSGPPIAARLND